MTTIDEVIADIAQMNRDAIAAFRGRIDGVERAYRMNAGVDGGAPAIFGHANEGRLKIKVLEGLDGAWYGIGARRIAAGDPREISADEGRPDDFKGTIDGLALAHDGPYSISVDEELASRWAL